MAIKVFPSANAVGGAGQKVLSEGNLAGWMSVINPSNYVVEGFTTESTATGGTMTFTPGIAVIDGHWIISDAAVTAPYYSGKQTAIYLQLSVDALGNATDAAIVINDTFIAPAHALRLAKTVWLDAETPVLVYDERPRAPYDPISLVRSGLGYQTWFDSLDGFEILGTVARNGSVVRLTTAAHAGSTSSIVRRGLFMNAPQETYWGPRRYVGFRAGIGQNSDITAYAITGYRAPSGYYMGFKFVNNTVYGVVQLANESEQTIVLRDGSAKAAVVLEALYVNGDIRYWVNGTLLGTQTALVPGGWGAILSDEYLFELAVTANGPAERTMSVSEVRVAKCAL